MCTHRPFADMHPVLHGLAPRMVDRLRPPDARVAIIFASKPSREQNEQQLNCCSELRKAIVIQANDLSVYNISKRISHGCHGRGERGYDT